MMKSPIFLRATDNILIEGLLKLNMKKRIAMARVLAVNATKIPVRVCNPTNHQVELGQGTKMATIEPWDNTGIQIADRIYVVSEVEQTEDIIQLTHIDKRLVGNEQTKMEEFLRKNSQNFSKNPKGPNPSSTPPHRIELLDETPIK
jgi:hypothetical protein